jgi:fatty-acyl-CoA synthase
MALRYPEREALIGGHQRLTFAQLATAVDAMAASLLRHGIGKGDKVAILMGNRIEWIVADFAICSIGAIMVGVNTWVTARELSYVLSHRSNEKKVIWISKFFVPYEDFICNSFQRCASSG